MPTCPFWWRMSPSTPRQELAGLPSSRHFSPYIPRSLWTPADPRNAHQNAFSVLASRPLKPSPSALMPITGLYQASGSEVSLVAYTVPCVRFSFVVRRLIPEVCASSSGSSGSLVSLPRSRGFPYTAVTPLTDLSLLLHCCNTRYEWLVRPCSTETSTLQKSVKLCLAH